MNNSIFFWQTAFASVCIVSGVSSFWFWKRLRILKKQLKRNSQQLQNERGKIQQLRHKLRESKKFLHLIINGIPQGVFWKDCDSVYLGCNEAFAKAAGLDTITEVIGKTDYDLPWSPAETQSYVDRDRECLALGSSILDIEETQLNSLGEISYLKTSRIPLFNNKGRAIGILGTFEDVTKQKKSNDSLRFTIEETASHIGKDFFPSCVQTIAEILDVDYALLVEQDRKQGKILALWQEGAISSNFEFPITQTPLASLTQSEVVAHYCLQEKDLLPRENCLTSFGGYNFFGIPFSDFLGNTFGYLAIASRRKNSYKIAEYELILRIFANRAAAEIQRQKGQVALEHQLRRANLLAQITRQIRSNLRIENVFQTTTVGIAQVFGVNRCHLITYDGDSRGEVTAEYCQPSYPSLLNYRFSLEEHPVLEQTLKQENAIAIINVDRECTSDYQQEQYQKIQLKSLLAVRTSYQGSINGGIALHQCDGYRQWTTEEIALLESVADSVGIAIAQAQLLEREITRRIQLDSRNKQLQTEVAQRKETERALERQLQRKLLLNRITQEIRQNLDSQTIFCTAATQIGRAFSTSRCTIHTYITSPEPSIPLVAEYLEVGCTSVKEIPLPIPHNPHAQVLLSQDLAIASEDVYQDVLLKNIYPLCQQMELKSLLAVRTSYQNKANGFIALHQCDRQRDWTTEEIVMLEAVAAQVGIAIAQANLLEQEQQQRKELEQAKQKAEVANEAKSEFLAKMSHELRTPLNAILGFSQIMYRDSTATPEQKEALSIINSSGEHLLSLISDVLAMSKIESGKMSLQTGESDLSSFLDALYLIIFPQVKVKGIKLQFELAPNLPSRIETDEQKLRQVLLNLLSNAVKFTEKGSVTLQVSCHATTETRLYFSIRDTGIGIAPEEVDFLFQPFVQTKSGRKSGAGTGLGLAISQHFVRLLGGEIKVQSQIGVGTNFQFDLPVKVLADNKEQANSQVVLKDSDCSNIRLHPDLLPPKILIAEDLWENRLFLRKLLGSVGFDLKEASNGQEAIALARTWQPDLILMDIKMPVMDGRQATAEIKKCLEFRPRIIAVTANAFHRDRESMLAAGCDDFVTKPFKTATLLEKIAQLLNLDYIHSQETLPEEPSTVELQQQIDQMPQKWQQQLREATIALDYARVGELISQISDSKGASQRTLQSWLEEFRFDKILQCLETPS